MTGYLAHDESEAENAGVRIYVAGANHILALILWRIAEDVL
jgi:hypothetical protein